MLHALFSFKGRLNRAPYWGYSILLIVLLTMAMFPLIYPVASKIGTVSDAQYEALLKEAVFWPVLLLTALSLWPTLALMAKRLQDHGKSGMLAIPLVIPGLAWTIADTIDKGSLISQITIVAWLIASAFSLVYLGCMRGTAGPNRFGPDPLDRSADMLPGAPASA